MSQLGPLANSLVKSYSKEEKYIIMVIMTILNFTTFSQFYISDMGRKIMGSNVVKCSNQWDKFCAKRLVERKILDSNPYFYQIFPAHHDIGMWIITQNFINSHNMLDFFFIFLFFLIWSVKREMETYWTKIIDWIESSDIGSIGQQ